MKQLLNSPLANLLLNDRGVAFNPATGDALMLNPTALRLVKLLQSGGDEDSLLRHLLDEYEVDDATARRDLDSFLSQLNQMQLL